ncbi:tetratricopeptide repeat protein [Metapseudomonas otitidis]|uniref:hypothetical protein n=1 Tax=Metapseudomonas otitidis TaxID=319939 RepID=UPI0013F5E001|nr:hypothetical protein [Pseudomonas otitidis]
MHTPDRPLAHLVLAITLALPLANQALACGPDFSLTLLDNRARTLAEMPENNFVFEATHLAPPIAGLKPVSQATLVIYWEADNENYVRQRERLERDELGRDMAQRVEQLRALDDPAEVEAQAGDLPEEQRLYIAGAVAFRRNGEEASGYFRRLLALPAEQRRTRSTWAAYSLGRAQAEMSRNLPASDDVTTDAEAEQRRQAHAQAAREAFQLTRQLAWDGFPDPLELAAASLGEEARVAKDAGDWGQAIRFYSNQAALNSSSGASSLKLLSGELARMPEAQLRPLLAVPEVQQLLTIRLLSRIGWDYDGQTEAERTLVQLLLSLDEPALPNADRLATLAYQNGRYDTARRLLEKAGDTGLAWWIRAKVALHDGDIATATQAYAKASQAFPEDESWAYRRDNDGYLETLKPHCRVNGERAVLALKRGDYLDALDMLYRSGAIYWEDTAALAERVLTLNELKGFVDAKVPAPTPQEQTEHDEYVRRPVATLLRELLGRRLMREGHYDEAPAYFATEELRTTARQYARARQEAQSRWTDIGQAEAYYTAAALARWRGMELLGYEMSPDFRVYGGSLYRLQVEHQSADGWLSEDEAKRQNNALADPNRRFHYRWVAADLAERAADRLPHTSQAFAAVLCQASGWLEYRDLDSARRIYRRYVENGPFVEWAANFGRTCEDPDFERAKPRQWEERWSAITALAPSRRHTAYGLGALLVAGGLLLAWRRRRA